LLAIILATALSLAAPPQLPRCALPHPVTIAVRVIRVDAIRREARAMQRALYRPRFHFPAFSPATAPAGCRHPLQGPQSP
jgi:hypothetical protein